MKLRRWLSSRLAWGFLATALAALVIQCRPDWRSALLYERTALAHGEWWRLWTGHLVHFGWPHFVADTGLFVILGYMLGERQARLFPLALVLLPAVIAGAVYAFAPDLQRYGGLSAVDLALLLFVAGQGWQRDWKDWFWPAVLAIYVGEIVLESTVGHGRGGGMIRFDDPSVRVATSAHVAAAACAAFMLAAGLGRNRPATDAPGAGRG